MWTRHPLHDPVFRTYLLIAAGVLSAAGLILLLLQAVFRKNVSSIWATYRSWLVMTPIIFAAVALGRAGVIGGVMLLSIFAVKEFARATGLYRDWWLTGAVYAAIVAIAVIVYMPDPYGRGPGWYGMFMALPVFAINLLMIIPILRNQFRGQLQQVALAVVAFIYIGWMFGHLGVLADTQHPYGYLLYIIFATELNDVAAFTFGRLLGRRPLVSNISPRKTWAGALGAAAFSMTLPWLVRFTFPHFTTGMLLLTGLIVGVGGQFGDLAISFVKRDVGVKDMGASIPGHGGLLDRIDSLIYVAPLFLHLIDYRFGLW